MEESWIIKDEILEKNGEIYVKDDFYDVAMRIMYKKNEYERWFMKHKGRNEFEVAIGHKTSFEVWLGGDVISKEEYERY